MVSMVPMANAASAAKEPGGTMQNGVEMGVFARDDSREGPSLASLWRAVVGGRGRDLLKGLLAPCHGLQGFVAGARGLYNPDGDMGAGISGVWFLGTTSLRTSSPCLVDRDLGVVLESRVAGGPGGGGQEVGVPTWGSFHGLALSRTRLPFKGSEGAGRRGPAGRGASTLGGGGLASGAVGAAAASPPGGAVATVACSRSLNPLVRGPGAAGAGVLGGTESRSLLGQSEAWARWICDRINCSSRMISLISW
mmetsp:Transcript_20945/g.37411  ORF Transcript_20945/g.37411 Transcript_20945/m.37411 type:complete len:251 (+) Transcript_20945:2374-3126(+)